MKIMASAEAPKATGQQIITNSLEEATEIVKEYEKKTKSKFVSRSCPRDFGKSVPICLQGKYIHWIQVNEYCSGIVPYIIIGKKQLDCQFGKDQKRSLKANRMATSKKKMTSGSSQTVKEYHPRASKKCDCPARIVLRDIVYFQDYKVPSDTKHFRYLTSKKLKNDFNLGKYGNITRHILVNFPSADEHCNHPENKSAISKPSGKSQLANESEPEKMEDILKVVDGALFWPSISGFPSPVNDGLAETVNNRPIIGILSQELSPDLLPPHVKGISYIAASYIKYIESAGGRVVPILTSMPKEDIDEIFASINGVLFPGGSATIFASKYFDNAQQFYNLAAKSNEAGDFFPIWGTCLGFQTLTSITAGQEIVSASNAIDLTLPLNFTSNAHESRMLQGAGKELMHSLSKEGLTYNFHYNCVTPDTFSNNKKLSAAYTILSYNNDVNGKTFISTIEGKHLPFYGTQWHPEKNAFEWSKERNIAHSKDAVDAAQYFANFFVNEARKSSHRFKSQELQDKYLIYNYNPVYTGAAGHFEQCYIFN